MASKITMISLHGTIGRNIRIEGNEATILEGISEAEIRLLLHQCFQKNSEFDAFFIDHYPVIYQKFTGVMYQIEKENILLHVKQSNLSELMAKVKLYQR